ncbi:MAG TPA: cysteine peptidase family C39 domain-containing protein [Phycisphaerae bacterium]|nr:cysteine peptidase family C39 domain-containing protein [Phycisphaerae bacterium]
MAWMELLAVAIAAALGGWLGCRFGRRHFWWLATTLCAAVLVASFAGHRSIRLSFIPPISWIADARANPPVVALAATLLMSILITHLPMRRTRTLTAGMAVAVVLYTCVWPLAMALGARRSLAAIHTTLNTYGVCLQSRTYTCGPASAVTCLYELGVKGDEGALAIESLCRPNIGIQPERLAAAITRLHARDGIVAEYRWVENLDNLPLPAVACMTTAGGHDIAVLQVEKDHVIIGDPARGLLRITRLNFMRGWTGAAIVLRTQPPAQFAGAAR